MNKQFITYLSNKLKTGNLKTIHLNVLPSNFSTRLDLTNLNIINRNDGQSSLFGESTLDISDNFLFNYLLTKSQFKFIINFDKVPFSNLDDFERKKYEILSKHLNSLFNQNEDDFLEHGIKTFGFGYPILIKRSKKDLTKIIKAPLFIWSLDISRSNSYKNQWIIERTEDSPVNLNEVMISFINSDEGITIDGLVNDAIENDLIDQPLISKITNLVLNKLGVESSELNVRIEPCPDKNTVESITPNKPWILWSGILGLFRTQKQSIIQNSDILLENLESFNFNDIVIEPFRTSTNTSVQTDPSQEEIIKTLESKEYKVIQGPPGTGKSQSLTAIITNILENGGKVLVVCEKVTALDVIYNNLAELGLDKLVAMVDDVIRDRKHIIDSVRNKIEAVKYKYQGFNEKEYDNKLVNYTELIKDFNSCHNNLLKPIFQGYSVKNIIAEFLKHRKNIKSNLRLFDKLPLKLNEDEYNHLLDSIQKGSDLYDTLDSNSLEFDHLVKIYFQRSYSVKGENELFSKIRHEILFLEKDNFILNGSINQLTFFKTNSIQFSYKAFCEYRNQINLLFIEWEKIYIQVNAYFDFTEGTCLRNDILFIVKTKLVYAEKNRIELILSVIKKIESALNLIQNAYLSLSDVHKLPLMKYSKFFIISQLFSDKQKRLTVFWKVLREQLVFINEYFSRSSLIDLNQNLFISLSKNFPTESDRNIILTLLTNIENKRKFYNEYHNWRYFYESENECVKDIISRLKDNFVPNIWKTAFLLNYFNLILESKEDKLGSFNQNNKLLERIKELQLELKSLQKYKIIEYWESKQFHSINKFNKRSNIKWLFNYKQNNQYSKKNSLRRIINDEFDLFTDLFPIILVNPIVCSSIIPLKQNIFDVVLFDEASQLRLEDTYPALLRGKIKVISGDKHQMPPSNYFGAEISLDLIEDEDEEIESIESNFEKTNPLYLAASESLLDFGNNLSPSITNTSYLDFHYRSKHPYLIDFSNAAFYGNRLVPMPEKNDYKPIRLYQINGLYESNNTNPSEAYRIIDFIKNDYPLYNDGKYPSLGIATFNIYQRDLIKDLLNDESIKDKDFMKKLSLINEKEDWFVKNLENIQGDERDIIIISTTFGLNSAGKFRQNFGPISTYKGYKLLNVIITRAKNYLYLFTSIPEKYYSTEYQDEIATKGNKGKALLYAYLDYCKSIEFNNEERRINILDLLKDK
ncbi:MAG: AAA domain-containing protein, partial [Ignavibacteriaceae bacterium]|nr:AAA domain-containing protein [Ignavibacteriaceae bacterium]